MDKTIIFSYICKMYENIQEIYFFTATCNSWNFLLEKNEYKNIIISSLNYFIQNNEIILYAFVIMSNHIHIVLHVKSENKKSFQLRFLKFTSQMIIKKMKKNRDPNLKKIISTQSDRKFHFWERNPKWISLITTKIIHQKINYCHLNPVKAKMCDEMSKYFYSSAHPKINEIISVREISW